MRQYHLLLLVLLIIPFASCKKNNKKTGTYTMDFQVQTDDVNRELSYVFPNAANQDLKIELLQFYISDIILVDKKGEDCDIKDIELVKIGTDGKASLSYDIPAGDYTKLKFNLGVPKELNEADPTGFDDSDHPLHVSNNTYWGWATMYRFFSLEGRYDVEQDGTFDGTYAYHTGFEESFVSVEYDLNMSMGKDGAITNTFNINLASLFDNGANSVDVVTEPTYHGNYEEVNLSVRVMNNLKSSLSME
ncbi:MAG: hypothetical protein MI810_09960 [Flavobacteriales bacterium]|nr:hypothetical protein [Flavobacteriales bacterium]